MKRFLHIILLIIAFGATTVSAEQWRLYPTWYGSPQKIIDTPDYVYMVNNNQPYWSFTADYSHPDCSLFRYNKTDGDLTYMNISNKLTKPVIQNTEYNYAKRYLLIAYIDGTIDLIYDNGDVVAIRGFEQSDASYSRNVNFITFDAANDKAYLSTDFGYIIINDKRHEISQSVVFDKKISSVLSVGGNIYVGSDDGLLVTESGPGNLTEGVTVSGIGVVKGLYSAGTHIYAVGEENEVQRLYEVKKLPSGDYQGELILNDYITNTSQLLNKVCVVVYNEARLIDDTGGMVSYPRPDEDHWKKGTTYDGSKFWVDCGLDGLVQKKATPGNNSWTRTGEVILPNASNAYKCTSMIYHPDYGMLVRNHRSDQNFVSHQPEVPDYISGLRNYEWTPYSLTVASPELSALTVSNPAGLVIDPLNRDQVYCGSVLRGLFRLDLKDPRKSFRIGRDNDEAVGMSGYVGWLPHNEVHYRMYATLSVPTFDKSGNLWVVKSDYSGKPDVDEAEVWVWLPEDRRASVSTATFKAPKILKFPDLTNCPDFNIAAMQYGSNTDLIVMVGNGLSRDFVVFDTKGTPDNQNDDKVLNIKRVIDQEGSSLGKLTFSSLYEDMNTGNVWVCHQDGVFHFNPKEALNGTQNEAHVIRPKIARNDGTNLADYLLDGVWVNTMTHDPQGRKWFGTNGGGIVITNSAGTEVLHTYTSSNSLLPDDYVYAMCYNPENGSMMISTGSGLAELYLSSASVGDGGGELKIYPNPVRPDFYGYVEIEGLEDDAIVKIADNAGNIIKEIGFASGGSVRWDVTNSNMKRVRSGVYYVLASGGPEGSGFGTVGKILVVN